MPDLAAPDIVPLPLELLYGASCGGHPDLFDDDGKTTHAKRMCASCPVKAPCLAHALEFEDFGIWGGTTPEERAVIRGRAYEWTWAQRVEAQRLRTLLSRGVAEADIAAEYAVSTRSVQRKKVEYLALTGAA